jgi:type II secretory pathway component PulF
VSTFVCRVVDAQGKRAVFRRDAAHEAAVLRDLNQEGYFILEVSPASSAPELPVRRLKPAIVLEFTQVLATLMANGLGLKEALSIARRIGGASVAPLLRHVEERVAKGDSLFESLSAWKSEFSPLYLGLVRIGEKSGDLATIFQRLSDYLAGKQALRDKMVNSLVYPVFVLGVALVGIILLATLVLPKLTGMIGSLNPQAAALYRRNVSGFQAGALSLVALLGLLGALALLLFRQRSRDESWARRLDSLLLRVPVAGSFARSAFGLNFSFAMETLLTSGYSLEDALEESSWVVGNIRYREGLLSARGGVVKGVLLSEALREEGIFPQVLVGWMAVGEGANDLVKSFAQVRAYYQKETDKLYARFMNLAEPGLIVAVGAILVTLILTFVTPIFTMLGNLL